MRYAHYQTSYTSPQLSHSARHSTFAKALQPGIQTATRHQQVKPNKPQAQPARQRFIQRIKISVLICGSLGCALLLYNLSQYLQKAVPAVIAAPTAMPAAPQQTITPAYSHPATLTTPPLVEYQTITTTNSQLLPSAAYAQYVQDKQFNAQLQFYNNSAIYNSESYETLSLTDIGDFIDESGRELLIQPPNPYAPANTPEKLNNATSNAFVTSTHVIAAGDSLWSLAREFRVSIDSIITRNQLSNVHSLSIGKTLEIPFVSGIYHIVIKGESLYSLADHYSVKNEAIQLPHNHRSYLNVGQQIFIANARIPALRREQLFGTLFTLPIPGTISSSYGMRIHPIKQKMLFHTGIDIAADSGSPVKAALGGKVIAVTREKNYGKRIVIRHALGYQTTYNHLSKFLTSVGAVVRRGQLIGRSGNTGLSTGPHLHFEIKHHNKLVNPAQFLKGLKRTTAAPRSHKVKA